MELDVLWGRLWSDPMAGVALTVGAYAAALELRSRFAWLHPLFAASVLLYAVLALLRVPLALYMSVSGSWLTALLGPATVALAVPLYKQWPKLKSAWLAVLGGVTAGSAASIAAAWGLVAALGGSRELAVSMLPKAATTPIAVEVSALLGGNAPLTASFTVMTGLLGSMAGPRLLRLFGVSADIPLAVGVGTASHGIGTARLVRESELLGGVSGAAMALAGIVTAVAAIPLSIWLNGGGTP
ncbi:LrgB family protein [Paenibacillus turpanensis]|uniref:LrgB family protein n=1 Tax=Paenibacillus turpanensis TaxID=2689078 RepID=UPI00140817B6|nr:LrgB family protein [Paenibacillus turpanensis]